MIEEIFNLAISIAPLYIMVLLGYLTGKFFEIDNKSISTIAIFILAPVVYILSLTKLEFSAQTVFVPIFFFVLAVVISQFAIRLTGLFMDEKSKYMMGIVAPSFNTGYFGLPIAFALFSPESVAIYVIVTFGFVVFESSVGLYYAARGEYSAKESAVNVFKYPLIYSVIIGLSLSAFNVELPDTLNNMLSLFKGAYAVIGMMLIGLGLSSIKRISIDKAFLSSCFGFHFVMWPLIMLGLIWVDTQIGILGSAYYKPMLLMSIMPMAANNIAYAAQFNMGEGRVSIAVVATTLFAIIYVPVMIQLLGIVG